MGCGASLPQGPQPGLPASKPAIHKNPRDSAEVGALQTPQAVPKPEQKVEQGSKQANMCRSHLEIYMYNTTCSEVIELGTTWHQAGHVPGTQAAQPAARMALQDVYHPLLTCITYHRTLPSLPVHAQSVYHACLVASHPCTCCTMHAMHGRAMMAIHVPCKNSAST